MRTEPLYTRRHAVLAGGVAATGALAGCLGGAPDDAGSDAAEPPTPVDLSGGKQDDEGGMLIGEHFGPNGQIFYAEHTPAGRDGPAWFHTLVAGLFPYHFRQERRGRTSVAVYVTDYSTVDYDLVNRKDRTFISSHTAPDTFALASDVEYVADSDVMGGMGKELHPFGNEAEAARFADEHGGTVVDFERIDREFIRAYR